MSAPTTIDEYLSQVSGEQRVELEKLRKTIKSVAPDTDETISYQMPTFKYKGKGLVGFAAFKDHCSFFPYSSGTLDDYKDELSSFKTSKGTIQFTTDNPLPAGLVKKIVKSRLEEIDAGEK
jgi:uncharacterized protein YdhG (YjbR/CyaY superfamily)